MEIKDTHWETELKIDDDIFKIIYGSGNQASNGLFINISFYHKKSFEKRIDDVESYKLKNRVLKNIRDNSYIYKRYFNRLMIYYREYDDYNINNNCDIAFQEFELTFNFRNYLNIRHYIIEDIIKELINDSLPIIKQTKLKLVNRNETKKCKR